MIFILFIFHYVGIWWKWRPKKSSEIYRLFPLEISKYLPLIFNFFLKKSSDDFRKWNEENKACYFPEDKSLSFFNHYSQDNCLMECKLKKIIQFCQCTPWYLKQIGFPVCTFDGNLCLDIQLQRFVEANHA